MSEMDGDATYEAEAADSPVSTDIEAPEADAVEQHIPVREDDEPPTTELPFDADEADAADQHRVVDLDDDDYR
jgi:hypothetical protein